jgi:hypothetical protein
MTAPHVLDHLLGRAPADTELEAAILGPWCLTHWTGGPPPFSLRTPQRNRNELGETTVNKTWRKHLLWQ